MGLFCFVKAAGEMLGIGGCTASAAALKEKVADLGLKSEGLDVSIDGDKVKVSGKAASQEEREKIVLALGNVAGVASVEDSINSADAAPEAKFYTVVKGDNLSKIAKAHYGNANKYPMIFEANRPM